MLLGFIDFLFALLAAFLGGKLADGLFFKLLFRRGGRCFLLFGLLLYNYRAYRLGDRGFSLAEEEFHARHKRGASFGVDR